MDIETNVFNTETKVSVRVSDFFWKLTDKESYKAHDTYLCGIEGPDFSETDQIRYTCDVYLPKICDLVEIAKVDTPYELGIKKRLMYFLRNYRKIAETSFQENRNTLVNLVQGYKPN